MIFVSLASAYFRSGNALFVILRTLKPDEEEGESSSFMVFRFSLTSRDSLPCIFAQSVKFYTAAGKAAIETTSRFRNSENQLIAIISTKINKYILYTTLDRGELKLDYLCCNNPFIFN